MEFNFAIRVKNQLNEKMICYKFQSPFSKTLPLNSTFQDLFNDILHFSFAHKLVDFLIFTCLAARERV